MNGPTGEVGEGLLWVDVQVAVDGCEQVLRGDGVVEGVFGFGVGLADDLAPAEAAAGDEGVRPVVAADLVREVR